MSDVAPRNPGTNVAAYSAKMQPYVRTLIDSGYSIHPRWNAQQIKGIAQALNTESRANLIEGQRRGWERMRAGEGSIYLVALIDQFPIVKIGYGLDVEKRFAVLKGEVPFKLKLVRHTPGSFYDERALHVRLWRYRWKGYYKREFYPADKLYNSGVDFPRGFMVGLRSVLDGAHGS